MRALLAGAELEQAQSGCEHLQRAVAQQNLDHVRVVQGLQAEIARVRGCSDLCRVLCCPCAPVLTPTMQCCHPCFHSPSTCCCPSRSLAGYQAGVIVQQERSARTELARHTLPLHTPYCPQRARRHSPPGRGHQGSTAVPDPGGAAKDSPERLRAPPTPLSNELSRRGVLE